MTDTKSTIATESQVGNARSFRHILHKCNKDDCFVCRGGLANCTVCGGAEASLPSDCPGYRMTAEQMDAVQRSDLDFKNGNWLNCAAEHQATGLNTPWTVRHDDDDYWCVANALGHLIFSSTGPDAETIARLVTAAPKLLAALHLMEEWAADIADDDSRVPRHVRNIAQTAIAEATTDQSGRAA